MTYRILVIVMVFAIGTVSFVNAQTSEESNLTRMSNDGGNIIWTIVALNNGGTLTISTPGGEVIRRVFESGGTPMFSSNDRINGGDGQYQFEIVLTPNIPDTVRSALIAARADDRVDEVYEKFVKNGIIPPKMIESGAFRVLNGMIYTADSGPEPVSTESNGAVPVNNSKTGSGSGSQNTTNSPEDQTINDDLIVKGSACVGLDCVTNENFGFDTLRLKENNLRINFADTSSSASFPTADWRIVANDTSNGGASYLAIEDSDAGNQPFRVQAGAGNAALWVTNNGGNVGMGTATPVVELHIADGDTPTVRLDQTGASGFTPQVWDVAGNEANFFVRDVTNGSQLPFQIKPGADTASLFIAANNNVGVGTGTPSQRLEVRGSILAGNNGSFIFESGSTGGIFFADGTFQSTAGGGGGGGEINTGSNVGAGTGVFKQKIGTDLEFKSLVAGSGVSVAASGANEILISSSGASLSADSATGFMAAAGSFDPSNEVNATITDGRVAVTPGVVGKVTLRFNIPPTANLTNTAGTMITYSIRYQDNDGPGANARVRIDLYGSDLAGANVITNIFDSNGHPSTGAVFVTLVGARPATEVDFNKVNWLEVQIDNFAIAGQAALAQIRMFRSP